MIPGIMTKLFSGTQIYFKCRRNESRRFTSQMDLTSSRTQIDILLHYYQILGFACENKHSYHTWLSVLWFLCLHAQLYSWHMLSIYSYLYLNVLFVFQFRVLVYSPAWPGTWVPLTLASQMLGLHDMCIIMHTQLFTCLKNKRIAHYIISLTSVLLSSLKGWRIQFCLCAKLPGWTHSSRPIMIQCLQEEHQSYVEMSLWCISQMPQTSVLRWYLSLYPISQLGFLLL